jgi:hypothetical protein
MKMGITMKKYSLRLKVNKVSSRGTLWFEAQFEIAHGL